MMLKPLHRIPTHYHRDWDDRENDFSWPELLALVMIPMLIWSVYWLCIHWVDHWVGDWLSWYVELLSPITAVPVMWVCNRYGKNPLHWWPMWWGYAIKLDALNADLVLINADAVTDVMGGRTRVWCDIRDVNQVYLKFRRKRDAVWFGLSPHFRPSKKKKKR